MVSMSSSYQVELKNKLHMRWSIVTDPSGVQKQISNLAASP